MIYLYSGTPGSGKSLHTAQVLYYQLLRGKPAICNFDFALDRIKRKKLGKFFYVSNDDLTPDLLISFSRDYFKQQPFHEGTILLVIDECQLIFNAREWQQKGRSDWLSFFTQHRKYGYDIILIAQFDRMIDRQIRSLIEYEQVHRKVSNFGIWGKLFSFCAGGKLFVSVKVWYPMKERVGSDFFKAQKKFYQLYDTYKHFEVDASPEPECVADEQKPPESPKDCAHRRGSKLNLSAFWQHIRELNLHIGAWYVCSGSGRYLSQYPEGRTETGWK